MLASPKFGGVGLLFALIAFITGKTAGQTMNDASISAAVQAKLTSDHRSIFPVSMSRPNVAS